MSEHQLTEEIERYLNGEMTGEERARFELLRKENADLNSSITGHMQFTNLLKQYGERLELERRLDAIHNEVDVQALKEDLLVHPSWIVQLWRDHHSKISVAASIAIFAIMATLFVTGKMDNKSSYQELSSKVDRINKTTSTLTKTVNALKNGNRVLPQDKYRGTGFAITPNGMILTA